MLGTTPAMLGTTPTMLGTTPVPQHAWLGRGYYSTSIPHTAGIGGKPQVLVVMGGFPLSVEATSGGQAKNGDFWVPKGQSIRQGSGLARSQVRVAPRALILACGLSALQMPTL